METEVVNMKKYNLIKTKILYPAHVEIETGLELHYAVEIQENGEYNTYLELSADEENECEETEEVCIRIADPETARKLAYALSMFADSMGEELDEEENSDDEEENEEDLPKIERNESILRKLEDMGIFLEIEDDGGEE